ncbi:hypothetical protein [Actinomycetospora aeridis]|uniref:Uncharacterized protein n=1 Tax=Actinomycetospora aeridis TaxID=3129231 RepID=A0ABU8N177_9PSEU
MMNVAEDYRRRQYDPEDISPQQTELATSLRVPFVTNEYHRWNYVCSVVVVEPNKWSPWAGLLPTDDEARMIASFIDEYREHWYRDTFKAVMAEFAPYDIDGGANLAILRKRPEDGGWQYRKRTWESGPHWWPDRESEPLTLAAVLDRVHTIAGDPMRHWQEWKSAHSEVFSDATEGTGQ